MMDGPFRGSEAMALGLVTWGRLRGQGFRRVFPDVYVPADAADDLLMRSRAAYLLVRDNGGALAGYSAALLLGADCAPYRAPAEVMTTGGFRGHPGLAVRWGRVDRDVVEVGVEVGGVRVTSAPRTAWDLARRLPLVEAVVAVEALARAGGFPPAWLLARREAEPGARGCRRLPGVAALADPRAESPGETRLRLLLVRGGLPVPEVQFLIRDEYGFRAGPGGPGLPRGEIGHRVRRDGPLHPPAR